LADLAPGVWVLALAALGAAALRRAGEPLPGWALAAVLAAVFAVHGPPRLCRQR
jgi:hypothetical protein